MIDKAKPVLIADDDDYFRLAIASILGNSLGFKNIVEASSHDQAIELLGSDAEGQAYTFQVPEQDFTPKLMGIGEKAVARWNPASAHALG